MRVFWLLLAAHVVTDFIQPNWLLRLRQRSKWGYEIHVLITIVLSAGVFYMFTDNWLMWSVLLGLLHWVIDRSKHAYQMAYGTNLAVFLIDQICHVFVVLAVTKFGNFTSANTFFGIDDNVSLLILGFVSVSFAASILIFEINNFFFKIDTCVGFVISWQARLVGMTERSVTLGLLLAFNSLLILPLPLCLSLLIDKDRRKANILSEKLIGAVSVLVVYLFIRTYS